MVSYRTNWCCTERRVSLVGYFQLPGRVKVGMVEVRPHAAPLLPYVPWLTHRGLSDCPQPPCTSSCTQPPRSPTDLRAHPRAIQPSAHRGLTPPPPRPASPVFLPSLQPTPVPATPGLGAEVTVMYYGGAPFLAPPPCRFLVAALLHPPLHRTVACGRSQASCCLGLGSASHFVYRECT